MESPPATAGTPTGQNDGKKRRVRIIVIASVVVVAVAGVLVWLLLAGRSDQPPVASTPTPTPEPTDALQFERPGDWSDYRPAVHLTPEQNWMNDPQRPF